MPTTPIPIDEAAVLPVVALPGDALRTLLEPLGLRLLTVAGAAPIPGSYWGEREAGLIGAALYLRADTPVHSVLHEAGHWLCMDGARRAALHTDAHSDELEERAVCCLQVLLADRLPGYSRARLFADMDAWGYHFALGSAAAWHAQDSADGRAWLRQHGVVGAEGRIRARDWALAHSG